ncbi:hypothetical protein QBC47DRAFT_397609 [Echria macrotheca]|uniref:Uncharacterized protein n=1 Tax=Echria macrotheca TaxID=438768 RepID=A0AAJ0F975_9PEZI|nr:hypothetical protein QBC47DRAFT_397609 [Echria macrotheca]
MLFKRTAKPEVFDTERLERLCSSLQPLMTKHVSDEELAILLAQTDELVQKRGNWFKRLFGRA